MLKAHAARVYIIIMQEASGIFLINSVLYSLRDQVAHGPSMMELQSDSSPATFLKCEKACMTEWHSLSAYHLTVTLLAASVQHCAPDISRHLAHALMKHHSVSWPLSVPTSSESHVTSRRHVMQGEQKSSTEETAWRQVVCEESFTSVPEARIRLLSLSCIRCLWWCGVNHLQVKLMHMLKATEHVLIEGL